MDSQRVKDLEVATLYNKGTLIMPLSLKLFTDEKSTFGKVTSRFPCADGFLGTDLGAARKLYVEKFGSFRRRFSAIVRHFPPAH